MLQRDPQKLKGLVHKELCSCCIGGKYVKDTLKFSADELLLVLIYLLNCIFYKEKEIYLYINDQIKKKKTRK